MEENKRNIRKGIILGCILSAAVLVGILGSYAYFIGEGNNTQKESASVQTGNMALTFSDGTSSFQGSLEFGGSATKTFTIENTGSLDVKAKINWKNLKNTYLKESLTYTLSYSETENGTYTDIITNRQVPRSESPVTKTLANNITIPVGKTYYYRLVITLNYLENVDQTADLNAILSTEFSLSEAEEESLVILRNLGLKVAKQEDNIPNFANAAITDETADGLYAMQDDYGTSYYFRGAVTNNYVKFGGFYWRIIRINGDGSLRMIYDGEQAYANGTNDAARLAVQSVAWNKANFNDAKYVGYMYGGSNGTASTKRVELGQEGYADSTNAIYNETSTNIKTEVEKWYKTNIRDKGLDDNVADSIYCNDRTTPGSAASGWSSDTGLGYGTNYTAYGAYARLYHNGTSGFEPSPKFTCEEKNDAFTKDDTTKGNGALSQKVGLITADEIVAAGSGYGTTNQNYYLYKGGIYWSFSSYDFRDNYAHMFAVNAGVFNTPYVAYACGIAPVISLSPEYVSQMIGDGTIGNEYHLAEDSFS